MRILNMDAAAAVGESCCEVLAADDGRGGVYAEDDDDEADAEAEAVVAEADEASRAHDGAAARGGGGGCDEDEEGRLADGGESNLQLVKEA